LSFTHQRNLEKAQRIVDDRLAGRRITAQELEWALKFCEQKEKMEEEEVMDTMKRRRFGELAYYYLPSSFANEHNDETGVPPAGSNAAMWEGDRDAAMWDDDLGGVQAPPVVLSCAPLTADNLGDLAASTGGNEDEAHDADEKPGSDSPLSKVSNVSELDLDNSLRKHRCIREKKTASSISFPPSASTTSLSIQKPIPM
jgi:hypothetical protein